MTPLCLHTPLSHTRCDVTLYNAPLSSVAASDPDPGTQLWRTANVSTWSVPLASGTLAVCGCMYDADGNEFCASPGTRLTALLTARDAVTQHRSEPAIAIARMPEAKPSAGPGVAVVTATARDVTLILTAGDAANGLLTSVTVTATSSFSAPITTRQTLSARTSAMMACGGTVTVYLPLPRAWSQYVLTIAAATRAGVGPAVALNITTLQAPPPQMPAPTIAWAEGAAEVRWGPGDSTNGPVLEYVLTATIDGNTVQLYRGTERAATVDASIAASAALRVYGVTAAGAGRPSDAALAVSPATAGSSNGSMAAATAVPAAVAIIVAAVWLQRRRRGAAEWRAMPLSLDLGEWELARSRVTMHTVKLGQGAFSTVFQGTLAAPDGLPVPVAVKMCARRVMTLTDRDVFVDELLILRMVSSPWHKNVSC